MYELSKKLEVDLLQFALVKPQGNAAKCYDKLSVSRELLLENYLDFIYRNGPSDDIKKPEVIFDFLDNNLKDILYRELGFEIKPGFAGCNAALSSAALDFRGNLWPCTPLAYTNKKKLIEYFNFNNNSLIDNSVEDIWQSEGFTKLRELNSRRLHAQFAEPCRNCHLNPLCGPCPLPYIMGESLDQTQCMNLNEIPIDRFKKLNLAT